MRITKWLAEHLNQEEKHVTIWEETLCQRNLGMERYSGGHICKRIND